MLKEEPHISKNTNNTIKKINDLEINPISLKNGDEDFYNFLLTKTRVFSFYNAKENLKYLKTRKFKDEKYKVTINNSTFFNFLGNNSLLNIINSNSNDNNVDNNNVLILSAKETNLCDYNNFKSIEMIFEIKHDDGFSSLHKHVIPFIVSSRLTSRYLESDLIRFEKNSLINNYFCLPNSIDCYSNNFNNIINYTKEERVIKQIEKTEAFNNVFKYGRLKKEFTDFFDYFEDLFNVFSTPKIEFTNDKIKRKEKIERLEEKLKQEKSSKNKIEEEIEKSNKESKDKDFNNNNKDDKNENDDDKNKKNDVIEETINLIEFDIFYDDYYNIFELKYYKKRIYKKLELHHQIKNLYLTSTNESDSINKQKEYIRLFLEFLDYFDKEILGNLNSSLNKSDLLPITTILIPYKYKDFIDNYITMIQESLPMIRFFYLYDTVSAKGHTLYYKIILNSLENLNLIEDHNSVIELIKVILKKLVKSKNNCIDLHLKELYEKRINCCGNDNILHKQFFYTENNNYNKEASELLKNILYKFFSFIKVRVVVAKEELVNSLFHHLLKNNSNDIKSIEEQDIRDKISNFNTKKEIDCSFPYFHYSKADEKEDNIKNYFFNKNKDKLDNAAVYENLFDIKMKEIIEVYNNDNKYVKLVNYLKDIIDDLRLKTKGKNITGEKSTNKVLNNKLEDIKHNMFILEENSYLIIRQVIDLLLTNLTNKNENESLKYHNLLIQHQLLKEKVNSNIEHYFNSCNYYFIIKNKSKSTFINEIKKLNYIIESSEEEYYNKLTSENDKRSFVFTEFCYLIETINTNSSDLMSISSKFSLKQKIENEAKYNDMIKDESFLEINFKIIKCSFINYDLVLEFLQKYFAITDKDI